MLAYLFERFPSFGQTFCYREVAELVRQGAEVTVFSIRRPADEPPQDWDEEIVRRVVYLPEEGALVKEIERAARAGELPETARQALKDWGRQTDFLRLYQASFVGLRMRKLGVTHVHAHFAGMAARTAWWLRRFFGFSFSVTAHANDIFAPRDFAIGLNKIFEAAGAIVTVSDFSAAQLKERFPREAAKIHRVYNGVEVAHFRAANFADSPPLIFSVGRLIEKKGFSDLIEACALLRQNGRAFRCEIAGEGPLQAELAAQIARSALAGQVRLIGPLPQNRIAERLEAAHLFVLPCTTDAEGGMDNLPTVILEAMASGLPVVSTPVAGIPEMVVPGQTGELVPERDPAAVARAIEHLLADLEGARELGRRGREFAVRRFSLESNVHALRQILERCASTPCAT